MKKLIVLGIIVMMITACSVAAQAVSGVVMNVQAVSDLGSFHTPQIGWLTDPLTTDAKDDGWDSADSLTPPAGTVQLDIVNSVIGSSKVVNDFRAPVLLPTDFQIFRFKATIANPDPVGEMIGGSFGLQLTFQPGYGTTVAEFYVLNGNYTSQSACEAAVPAALAVVGPGSAGWTSAPGLMTIGVPVYNADEDTWSTPSKFFTIYAKGVDVVVPEPASILAMFSGLVGLVGFGIRRRK